MAWERNSKDMVQFVGLWMNTSKKSGDRYWSSAEINPKDLEIFMEFIKEPTKIMIFKNKYKKTEKYPDAFVQLVRVKDKSEWREYREDVQEVKEETDKKDFEEVQEEAPF